MGHPGGSRDWQKPLQKLSTQAVESRGWPCALCLRRSSWRCHPLCRPSLQPEGTVAFSHQFPGGTGERLALASFQPLQPLCTERLSLPQIILSLPLLMAPTLTHKAPTASISLCSPGRSLMTPRADSDYLLYLNFSFTTPC